MSIDPSPPVQPLQMSPDKKWFWDGTAWKPIPVHEAAFPSWKGLGAGFVPETAPATPAAAPPPARRQQATPVPAYRMAAPSPDLAAPLWRRGPAPTGIKKYANIAAGVIAIVVVAMVAATFIPPIISSRQASPAQATATPGPTAGPATRSESARASYLMSALDQPMADLKDATTAFTSCRLGMTSACVDSVNALDNAATKLVAALGAATAPDCIATQEGYMRADVGKLSANTQLALKGYKDGRKSEFSSGVNQAYPYLSAIQVDYWRITTVLPACSGDVTGP